MKSGRIYLKNSRELLIEEASLTTNALERMRGLLFRAPLKSNQALLIKPCSSVHTLGMTYAIDLIYLSKDFRVMKVIHKLAPLRMSACRGAHMVIELFGGTLSDIELENGTELLWEDV